MQKEIFFQLTKEGKKFFQLFTRFLKENNYFYNYKKAFENSKRMNKLDKLILCCNRFHPEIIDKTLYWTETDEGFDYWKYANYQFMDLCYHLQKKLH